MIRVTLNAGDVIIYLRSKNSKMSMIYNKNSTYYVTCLFNTTASGVECFVCKVSGDIIIVLSKQKSSIYDTSKFSKEEDANTTIGTGISTNTNK